MPLTAHDTFLIFIYINIISSLKTGSRRYAKIFTTVIIHPHRVMFINSRHGWKAGGIVFAKRVRRRTPTVGVQQKKYKRTYKYNYYYIHICKNCTTRAEYGGRGRRQFFYRQGLKSFFEAWKIVENVGTYTYLI